MKKIALVLLLGLGIFFSCSSDPEVINGKDGKSAFELWKAQKGNENKTLDDFFNFLKGKDGVNGKNGKDGLNGKDGTNGLNGKDGKNGKDGDGVTNEIILFGDVTNEEAQRIIENSPTKIDKVIVKNTTQLTQVNFSKLEQASEINVFNNNILEHINFGSLKTVYEGLYIGGNRKLTTCSFPMLKSVTQGDIDPTYDRKSRGLGIVYNENLSSINFPELTEVEKFRIIRNKNLSSFVFPKLVTVIGGFEIGDNQSLRNFELPKLMNLEYDYDYEKGGGLYIYNNVRLESFDLSKLTNFIELTLNNDYSVNIDAGGGSNNNYVSSIEKLLKHFVDINLKGKEIYFYDYTATKVTQGYIDTLIRNGNNISGFNKFVAEPLNEPYIEFVNNHSNEISLAIDANEEDRQNVWIDLNCNSVKDDGEDIKKFTDKLKELYYYKLTSEKVRVYGKVTKFGVRGYLNSLKLSHSPQLKALRLEETRLSKLDVSKNTLLTNMDIENYNRICITVNQEQLKNKVFDWKKSNDRVEIRINCDSFPTISEVDGD